MVEVFTVDETPSASQQGGDIDARHADDGAVQFFQIDVLEYALNDGDTVQFVAMYGGGQAEDLAIRPTAGYDNGHVDGRPDTVGDQV